MESLLSLLTYRMLSDILRPTLRFFFLKLSKEINNEKLMAENGVKMLCFCLRVSIDSF